MGSYEILPIGTKLKNLRRKYNVKQDEVSGKDVTRNLISQIEHGKANLTKHAAQIVLKNLKTICDKKHIAVSESIEYLMEDKKSQASKILDRCIKELKDLMVYKDNSFVDKLTEVEEFLVKWNITDKKIAIFELAGDYFVGINDYYKSSLYYEKARALMDIHSNKNSLSILRKLSMVYFYMGKYEDDINCCQFALDWFNDILTEKYRCIFLFNSALCYTYSKDYYKAIGNLTTLESIIKDIDINKYYEVLIQKAICLEKLKRYTESLNLYNKVADILQNENIEQYVIILANMLELFRDSLNYDSAKKTLNKMLTNIVKIKNSRHLSTICLDISKTFKWLKDYENAEKYCLKSLEISKKYMHYFVIDDTFSELIDIYIITNNAEKISEMKNEFFIISSKENKLNTKIMLKLIGSYLKSNDTQSIQEIYNFSTKFA